MGCTHYWPLRCDIGFIHFCGIFTISGFDSFHDQQTWLYSVSYTHLDVYKRQVTTPAPETVATVGSDEVHVTALLVAFAGAIVAVRVLVPAGRIFSVDGATVTPVTAIFDGGVQV